MITIQKYGSYRFGSAEGLDSAQMESLIAQFRSLPKKASDILSGRNQPHFMVLNGFGPVVIKHYFRGGVIRHVNRRTYMKLTQTRGEAEFALLNRIRNLGVNAPEPIAFAYRGGLFYRAWLVTRNIPGAKTLSEISRSAPERADASLSTVIEQVNVLIDNGILHVDLHPGNVLIDETGKVFLIDLDKAETGRKNRLRMGCRYLQRWERAVRKYGLPEFLSHRMRAGLINTGG